MRRLLLLGAFALAACEPETNQRTFLIDRPTILAIQSEPAEAAPNDAVTYTALVAAPQGTMGADASMAWAYCNDRKPLAELGPVSKRCMTVGHASYLQQLGGTSSISASVPDAACRNFGPDVPPPQKGEPNGRPVDPDSTGGYYQPVRLVVDAGQGEYLGIGDTRLACGIANVTPDISIDYHKRYKANSNPTVSAVTMDSAALQPESNGESPPNAIAPRKQVKLHVSWPTCDSAPCPGSEPYVVYDAASKTLVDRKESIIVSWYVTGGDLGNDASNPGAGASGADNTFTAPSQPGAVHLWIVLLDDRGGQSWQSFRFDVK